MLFQIAIYITLRFLRMLILFTKSKYTWNYAKYQFSNEKDQHLGIFYLNRTVPRLICMTTKSCKFLWHIHDKFCVLQYYSIDFNTCSFLSYEYLSNCWSWPSKKNNVSKNRQKWKRSLILFRMHWSLIRNRMSLCILNRKRKAFLSQTKTLFLHLVSMCRLTCIWGIYNIMNIRITIKWMLSNILSQ